MDWRASLHRGLVGAFTGVLCAAAGVHTGGMAAASAHAWTTVASFPPTIAYVQSVSCFSSTGCVAVGWTTASNGQDATPIELRTLNAGALWSPVPIPHDLTTLTVVQCNATLCLAGGAGGVVLRSTNDGLTWQGVALPSTIASVTAIACPSSTACFAEGAGSGSGPSGAIVGSTDGGTTWTSQYGEATTYLHSLWCASVTSCFAYGTTFLSTSDGSTWGVFLAPGAFPTQAVCPSASTCLGSSPAAGIVQSTDGGGTWAMVDGSIVLSALACGSATACVGTDGTNLVLTTDGGASWTVESPSFPSESLLGVACPSAENCQVVGSGSADAYPNRALLLGVGPGTGSFSTERVSNALDSAASASCPSPTVCAVAVVDPYANPMLLRTTNAGSTWTDVATPAVLAQVDQVLCVTTTSCLVAGSNADGSGAVWRSGDAGRTWTAAAVPSSVGEVNRLWCAGVKCEATGYLTNSWTTVLSSPNGGRTWSSRPMPHTATDLYGVVCSTGSDCVAIGGRNDVVGVAYFSRDAGRTWRSSRLLGAVRALNAVACPSAKVCVAAASVRHGSVTHGVLARTSDAGATWGVVTAPGSTALLVAVSCWSALACEAVGQTSAALDPLNPTAAAALGSSNAGRSWTVQPVPKDTWILSSLSCARSGACLAAGIGSFSPPSLPTGATIARLS